ncbi:hypothetical protein EVA_11040 [gut metagenome]|uniref:Uncharacterized protein n=1 Tax=gut metagenome TaxID=749906 RepID=J9CL88_9ZZZZ
MLRESGSPFNSITSASLAIPTPSMFMDVFSSCIVVLTTFR